MSEPQDSNRSEQATPHKLQEARKKGSVAKSTDLVTLAPLMALVAYLIARGSSVFQPFVAVVDESIATGTHLSWSVPTVAAWLGHSLVNALSVLAPLACMIAAAAVLAHVLQSGVLFAPSGIKPDLSRINPVQGFKKFWSIRVLAEFVKTAIKLSALSAVAYYTLKGSLSALQPSAASVRITADHAMTEVTSLVIKLVAVLAIAAAADWVFARWEFSRRMRMSVREIKDEVKQREGDPRIRRRLRELRVELMKRNQSLGRVPGSDVVITNPTHFAVALCYTRNGAVPPTVVAKGAGALAAHMRTLAARSGVPVVQNVTLARALYRDGDIDGVIPERCFADVAKVFVWLYAQRDARASARPA